MEFDFRRGSLAGSSSAEDQKADSKKPARKPRPARFAGVSKHSFIAEHLDGSPCCERKCWSNWDVSAWRRQIIDTQDGKTEAELSGHLATILNQLPRSARGRFKYRVQDLRVCSVAWAAWYGIRRHKLKSVRRMAQHGSIHTVHGNTGGSTAGVSAWVSAALHQFIHEETDVQADGTRYLSRHVSISTIMDYLLQKYCEDGLPEGEEPSVRTLRRVWNNDPIFANVRIPLKGQWGICNHCLELAERRRNAFANLEQRQQYVADLRAHRKAHRLARNGFERRKMLAMTEPEKYHSIIVDLTRSAWLPHSHPLPKRLEAHLGGAICWHSNRKVLFSWLPREKWKKGSDVISTVLLNLILADKTSGTNMALARTLYLQVDGGSENNNQWVIALCGLLVHLGLYDEVYLNRMLVGHTHSQIDQFFRPLRAKLLTSRIFDGASLVAAMRAAFVTSEPTIALIEEFVDFSGWIDANLLKYEGHKKPLGMKFALDKEGRVGMWFKAHPEMDRDWLGANGKPDGRPVLLFESMPDGQPGVRRDTVNAHRMLLHTIERSGESMVPRASVRWMQVAANTASWQLSMISAWMPGDFGQRCVIRVGDNVQSAVCIRALPNDVWRRMQDGARAPVQPEVQVQPDAKYTVRAVIRQRLSKPRGAERKTAAERRAAAAESKAAAEREAPAVDAAAAPAPVGGAAAVAAAPAANDAPRAPAADGVGVRPRWQMQRVMRRLVESRAGRRMLIWHEQQAAPAIAKRGRKRAKWTALPLRSGALQRLRADPQLDQKWFDDSFPLKRPQPRAAAPAGRLARMLRREPSVRDADDLTSSDESDTDNAGGGSDVEHENSDTSDFSDSDSSRKAARRAQPKRPQQKRRSKKAANDSTDASQGERRSGRKRRSAKPKRAQQRRSQKKGDASGDSSSASDDDQQSLGRRPARSKVKQKSAPKRKSSAKGKSSSSARADSQVASVDLDADGGDFADAVMSDAQLQLADSSNSGGQRSSDGKDAKQSSADGKDAKQPSSSAATPQRQFVRARRRAPRNIIMLDASHRSNDSSSSSSSSSSSGVHSGGLGLGGTSSDRVLMPPPPASPVRTRPYFADLRQSISVNAVGTVSFPQALSSVSDHVEITGYGSWSASQKKAFTAQVITLLACIGFSAREWEALARTRDWSAKEFARFRPPDSDHRVKLPSIEEAVKLAAAAQQSRALWLATSAVVASPSPGGASSSSSSSNSSASAAATVRRSPRAPVASTLLRGTLGELGQQASLHFATGDHAIVEMADAAAGLPFCLVRIVEVRSDRSCTVEWYRSAEIPPNLFGRWLPHKDPKQTDTRVLTSIVHPKHMLLTFSEGLDGGHLPEPIKQQLHELAVAEAAAAPSASGASSSSSSASAAARK